MCLTMTCKSSPQDHNGNKENHFLFFVSSWVVISKPWDFANFKILYMYFKCVFNILLYCFMLLICDTKINNNNKKLFSVRHSSDIGQNVRQGFPNKYSVILVIKIYVLCMCCCYFKRYYNARSRINNIANIGKMRQYTIQVNKLIDFYRLISDVFLCSKRHYFFICEWILIIQVALSF